MKKTLPIILIITGVLLAGVIAALLLTSGKKKEDSVPKFLASDTFEVTLYEKNKDANDQMEPAASMVRGTAVQIFPTAVETEEGNFYELDEGEKEKDTPVYYVKPENVVDTEAEVVQETTCYVRTSATAYKTPDAPDIASFFKKGTELAITGFDTLLGDGKVDMYKVKAGDAEGYVYSKYLVFTQEEANAVNTEYYDLNKDKIYETELYCGLPTSMDYFPYDKNFATTKVIPAEARTFYLNAGVIDSIDSYIECAQQCGCNAFVIDIKDGGLAYHAEVAQQYSPTAYASSYHDNAQYKAAIDKAKAAGIWTIGRIVVFNDEQFAADNPDECIYNNGVNQEWPSAYSRKAWEYNVKLAVSAVQEMGFDEIQFDYVRFPENTFFMSRDGGADFKNTYGEEKAEAIQNFCFYSADQIHKAGAYFSVDVFGECSNGYVTAYGQYWPAISLVVDAISSMPYVDHFGRDIDTWSDSYTTVYNWAEKAAQAQTITPNPAIARTWLTCYDVPYWDPVIYADSNFLGQQVQALWDAGIGQGGFITWNAGSSLDKYYTVSDAFRRVYTPNG